MGLPPSWKDQEKIASQVAVEVRVVSGNICFGTVLVLPTIMSLNSPFPHLFYPLTLKR
jgi:hypothetical protein